MDGSKRTLLCADAVRNACSRECCRHPHQDGLQVTVDLFEKRGEGGVGARQDILQSAELIQALGAQNEHFATPVLGIANAFDKAQIGEKGDPLGDQLMRLMKRCGDVGGGRPAALANEQNRRHRPRRKRNPSLFKQAFSLFRNHLRRAIQKVGDEGTASLVGVEKRLICHDVLLLCN